MGKGDKQRARARKKDQRVAAGLPELAEVPRREKDGASTRVKRTVSVRQERAPDKVALQARARMMGQEGQPLELMRTQALGEEAGQAIYLAHGVDPKRAAALWAVYAAFTASEARYARVVLGKSLYAKSGKIETMPERFEARADDEPDLRTEDEKHRDAVNSWMHWRGLIGQLRALEQSALFDAAHGRVSLVCAASVTPAGHRFVMALERLEETAKM